MASKILYNTAPTWPSKKCECKRIGKTARVEGKKWWTVVKVKYQPFEQLLHKWTIMPIHFYCRQQQFPYLSYATFCKHSAQVDPVRCVQTRTLRGGDPKWFCNLPYVLRSFTFLPYQVGALGLETSPLLSWNQIVFIVLLSGFMRI